jgi:hypothetical protein
MADKRTTLDECLDAAGSFNNPATPNSGLPTVPSPVAPNPGGGSGIPGGMYVPPEFCVGTYRITQDGCASVENQYQAALVAQALSISGAPLNVFKLLGVHEQGKLIDLIGKGAPIGSNDTSNAFDALAIEWASDEQGLAVVQSPAYIGYDFGVRMTSFGLP